MKLLQEIHKGLKETPRVGNGKQFRRLKSSCSHALARVRTSPAYASNCTNTIP